MASKLLTLQMGGRERTMCFGKLGFTENIQVITGQDPFQYLDKVFTLEGQTPKEMFEHIEAVTYAGLLSQCDFEGKEPDFKAEDVHRWVKGLEISDGSAILNECASAILSLVPKETQGEAVAQANHEEVVTTS